MTCYNHLKNRNCGNACAKGDANFFKTSCLPILCFVFFTILAPTLRAQDLLAGLTSAGGPGSGGTAFTLKSTGTSFTLKKSLLRLGTTPHGDLIQGKDGNFYGMTYQGGIYDKGTVFKMTPAGSVTILRHLDHKNDGGYPDGSLVQGPDGWLYGMTSQGGYGYGTIFKISATGAFQVLRKLFYTTDGAYPHGSLVLGKDGNLYGMTHKGGDTAFNYKHKDYGTIFRISPTGDFLVIAHLDYYITGGNAYGSLVAASDGNFYGMTYYGSKYDFGAIFKVTPAGTLTILKYIDFRTTGGNHHSGLKEGPDGALYGMMQYGGPTAPNYGGNYGTIFRITKGGDFRLLYNFNYYPKADGANPNGDLYLNSDGWFYGVTQNGGKYNAGTVFKIAPSGGFTVLHHINGTTDGANPLGSVVKGSDGYFYGMASKGGISNLGTIFKMSAAGTYATLLNLPADINGYIPQGSLVQGRDGSYYSTTSEGGKYGYGAIFKLCNGTYQVIHSMDGYMEGAFLRSGLVQGSDGNFYGMANQGGYYGYGTIYKVTPTGALAVLRNLNGSTDGANPYGALIQGKDGFFYGMTYAGGSKGYGTIFKISSTGAFTLLRTLDKNVDGSHPIGDLLQGTDGNFYGMTYSGGAKGFGTIFKMTSAGMLTVLNHLDYYSLNGAVPFGSLIQARDGNFYGLLNYGGAYGYGTVFKMTPAGAMTALHSFAATDGFAPKGSLLQGSDGAFYGTTSKGGTYSAGTIFRITSGGTFTVLRHLNLATDGGAPLGNLMIQKGAVSALPQSVTTAEDVSKTITLTYAGSGASITYSVTGAPKNGTLSGTGMNRTYIPKANFHGKDSFYFTTTWGCQTSAPAKVLITITPVNDAPVLAAIGNKTVIKGATVTFTAGAMDVDAGQTKTFSLVAPPAGATINAINGVFSWTPSTIGTFTVKVRITDNGSPVLYDEEQITVTVSSATVSTTAMAPAEITEREINNLKTRLYPNPVSSCFTVQLGKATGEVQVTILDGKGAVHYIKRYSATQQLQIDAQQLRPGTYLLQLQTKIGTEVLKFVKL
jgi:uncharacterized repeat protein (TIGR03803 family)